MSVLRTIVSSSRALVTGAKDVARFREIATVFVRHGFGWFFAQLKLRRELQVDFTGADLTRAAVGSPDTGKRLVAAFSKLGPTFVKLGQILSTRPDLLPPGILGELTQLQDQVSPLPFDQVVQQLRLALGPGFREHFETLDEAPLASASIAQVHRATLKDGTAVVLKVQRPGLRPKIESDLNILRMLAGYVEDAFEEAAAMDIGGVIRGFSKSLAQELDFRCEARNMARFRRNFADTAHFELVKTDAEGKASVRFKFPDNLGSWRVRAIGISGQTEVGEGSEGDAVWVRRGDGLVAGVMTAGSVVSTRSLRRRQFAGRSRKSARRDVRAQDQRGRQARPEPVFQGQERDIFCPAIRGRRRETRPPLASSADRRPLAAAHRVWSPIHRLWNETSGLVRPVVYHPRPDGIR